MLWRRGTREELVEAAGPLAAELAGDEKLQRSALTALASALAARNRLLASVGVAGLGWRVANDRVLQRQFGEAVAAARDVLTRAERLRARRRRRQRLLLGGGVAL